ncbi:DUF421 domain-containing protein [Hathewaya limosa]|uniref:Uncharacterized membrane protein YcaP (DUF421 family) n=1 Tax=Hathewaya limosa TaxID=1536 RepID=A0ABU0JS95_HATLI|nr:DUF421 domain-containing protein [Hathewaya limosa]AWZ47804.1 hypothetical protein C3495_02615 [Clostridiaceae bacterium 14S0207]MDQ0479944.1 uncharacterized membrane protein YcaP (DUF421 family) [Hathewaya limosa]
MYILLIRTVILYFLALLVVRLMGKRQIGELQPFEIVLTVMVSELASVAMQDNRIPLIHTIIPLIVLLILQVITSIVQLKSEKARVIFSGKPSILIENGKIDVNELRSQRININDLLEELRLKDIYNVDDVQYAILETSGQLSIIPKSDIDKVTKQDLNIKVKQEKMPVSLILDGNINNENLRLINKDKEWLMNVLENKKIYSAKNVFHAYINTEGKFMYQLKDKKKGKKK